MHRFDSSSQPWDGQDVPALLVVDPLGDDVFAGRHNQPNLNGSIFGGQVLAQALAAATATVDGKTAHSLHCYFLRAGTASDRVVYAVERRRDGRRFSMRRVVVWQGESELAEVTCSFFIPQVGYEHQTAPSLMPPPEGLADLVETAENADLANREQCRRFSANYPIEIRPLQRPWGDVRPTEPRLPFWVRVPSAGHTADPALQQQILAYLSDFWLAATALAMHRQPMPDDTFSIMSLDHAIWFHRPACASDWLFYDTESPSASHGVNLARGLIYDRQGRLIASVAQEALQVENC